MNQNKDKNQKWRDSSSKLIFGDAMLCAQFLRDYIDIPMLKDVKPEDIEDVSERYVPLFTSEREADTVKKVRLSETDSLFFISLIEHKTTVDYNVVMQIFRYMCFIWDDFEKEAAKRTGSANISSRKDFKYPPILPIIYYEGKGTWTAVRSLKERIFLSDVFGKYIPDFTYELINLQDYTSDQLIQNQDEISLLMLLNKIQGAEDFKALPELAEAGTKVWRDTPEYLLKIIAKVTTVLMYRLNLPEEEVEDMVSRIKERKMPELFEHFKGYDIQATRREAREEGKLQVMVSMVCRKLEKNQSVAQIAESLEEDREKIEQICHVAKKYAPDYDVEQIVREMLKKETDF